MRTIMVGLLGVSVAMTCVGDDGLAPRRLEQPLVQESSGVAVSRRLPDVYWTHNDSGDKPRIYAFDLQGKTLGIVDIEGASAIDWEDMASFRWRDRPWLIIADIGDNAARRSEVTLYAFPEPDPRHATTARVERTWRVRYPSGPHDCEAIAVDPVEERILLMDKSLLPIARLFSLPLDSRESSVEAQFIGDLNLPAVTSMDFDVASGRLVINTYADAWMLQRRRETPMGWESWSRTLGRSLVHIPLPKRRQGEGIAFSDDGKEILVTTEGSPCEFWVLPTPMSE